MMKTIAYYLMLITLCTGTGSLHALPAAVQKLEKKSLKTIDPTLDKMFLRAISWGNVEAIAKLFAGNTIPHIEVKNKEGETPLILAIRKGHKAVAQLLIEIGANIEAQDSNGNTPLMWAAKLDRTDILQFLIAAGADLSIKNKQGKTAFDVARDKEAFTKAVKVGLDELAAYRARQAQAQKIIEEEKQLAPVISNIIAGYAYGQSTSDLPETKIDAEKKERAAKEKK